MSQYKSCSVFKRYYVPLMTKLPAELKVRCRLSFVWRVSGGGDLYPFMTKLPAEFRVRCWSSSLWGFPGGTYVPLMTKLPAELKVRCWSSFVWGVSRGGGGGGRRPMFYSWQNFQQSSRCVVDRHLYGLSWGDLCSTHDQTSAELKVCCCLSFVQEGCQGEPPGEKVGDARKFKYSLEVVPISGRTVLLLWERGNS